MYLLLAVAAGFASVWLWGVIHRSYEGWYAVAWRVACYFPGISLLLLSVLNVLIHHTGSSGAIPLGAFFSLVSLWFLISIPLCFSGQLTPLIYNLSALQYTAYMPVLLLCLRHPDRDLLDSAMLLQGE